MPFKCCVGLDEGGRVAAGLWADTIDTHREKRTQDRCGLGLGGASRRKFMTRLSSEGGMMEKKNFLRGI